MRALALALLACLASAAAAAQPVPPLTGRVVDAADMLSPTTEAAITARLAAFEDSTSTQIVVLTVPSLGGSDLEAFSTDVFRTWGIGQTGSNNGALLLIARDDRTLRIEVGYGLEGDLTDARAATIIRETIVPRMRDGDPDAAVSAGVDAMIASVEGAEIAPAPGEPMPWWGFVIFGGLFTVLPVGALWGFLRTGIAGFGGTVVAGIVGLLAGAFVAPGVAIVTGVPTLSLAAFVLVSVGAMVLDVWLERHPVYGPARRTRRERNRIIRDAQRRGKRSVVIGGQRVSVPSASSSSSGGGFSGGGGSSGGGGASGSW